MGQNMKGTTSGVICLSSHSGSRVPINWAMSRYVTCQRGLKEQSFWTGIVVARSLVNDANVDTLCASRREKAAGESTFGSFIYNKL